MKRNLNTSYRLVWNDVLGAFVVVSELATARGKRSRTVLAIAVAGLMSTAALAAGNTTVPAGQTVDGAVISNHDTQEVWGSATGTVVNTGQEYGDNDDANTGGQFVQSGGVADNTTVNRNGLQAVLSGGSATRTTINAGGGQSVHGQATDSVLNGGEQWVQSGGSTTGTVISAGGYQLVKSGAQASGTVVNTGAEGGPDAENSDGMFVSGIATDTLIHAGGRQIVAAGGLSTGTTIQAGGDQSVHGQAQNTTLDGGNQYVHAGAQASGTTVNAGGWQVVQQSGTADATTVNRDGKLSVAAGGTASNVTLNAGGALVTSTAATVSGINSLGSFNVDAATASATNVLLENGGRLDVLSGGSADTTTVSNGGVLAVATGGVAQHIVMNEGGVLIADSGSTVSGTNTAGTFGIDAATGRASNLHLGNGSTFSVRANGVADNTTVSSGGTLNVSQGGVLSGTTTLTDSATLSGSATSNDLVQVITATGTGALITGSLGGNGQLLKDGGGTLTVSNGTLTQSAVNLNQGALILDNAQVSTDIIAQSGTLLTLTGNTVMNGAIDPTDFTLDSGATWNIDRHATVASVLDTLSNAGTISFSAPQGNFVPATLTVKNLTGRGGSISMFIRLDDPAFPTDRLVIDGGQATGKTWLNFTSTGNSRLGLATTGNGIKVVDAVNGATTTGDAFALGHKLQAGAYNYTLNHGTTDESWYLSSESVYRSEVALYASLYAQSMDYDRALAGTYSQRSTAQEARGMWGRVQGGHTGHGDRSGIAQGATPESSGSYGFVQLGGDLVKTQTGPLSLTAGMYGAAGESRSDVKNDDRSAAGTARDTVYSLGGYLTAVHQPSGLWTDVVAQGSRHSLKAQSDNNNFDTHGQGWLGSVETGLPLSVSQGLVLEPQLQYVWQGLSLNNGHDDGGYMDFGHGTAQHVRAGLRFGNQSEMAFGQGSSTLPGHGRGMKHSISELPVSWWVRPSVVRTFSSQGNLDMGTATPGSNVTFSPSQDGTSAELLAGVSARVRDNVTLGVQGGYTRSVSGNSAEGYNGQASVKVMF